MIVATWNRFLEQRRLGQAAVPAKRRPAAVWLERACFATLFAIVAHLLFVGATATDRIRVAEGSPLEVGQLVLLAAALLIFMLARFRSRGPVRAIATLCAHLMATVFLMEIDVKTLPDVGGPASFDIHDVKELLLVANGLFALIAIYGARTHCAAIVGRCLIWSSWPFHLGTMLTFGGAIILDGPLRFVMQAQHFEETAELAGYFLFVVAALRTWELAGSPPRA